MADAMIAAPAHPVTVWRLPDGDVLLLPAIWPVRLNPEQQQALAQDLLDSATPTSRS